jgi:hypothetical protein
MTDKTIGIIYAIKRSGKIWNQAVAEWMSNYSGSPVEKYTETLLNKILKEAFIDYMSTCDKPGMEVSDFLDLIENNGSYSLGHHIANKLGMTQVKEGNKFVNGFREL